MRWLLPLGLCAGCDNLFRLEHVDPVRSDGAADAPADVTIEDVATDVPPFTCPMGYVAYATLTNRYRFTSGLDWLAAELDCEDDRGTASGYTHLAVFADDVERTQVNLVVLGSSQAWIGVTDRHTEGLWRWVTAEPIPASYPPPKGPPWDTGEPNGTTGENCVQMRNEGKLNDYGCNAILPYLCECDPHPPVPANYTP